MLADYEMQLRYYWALQAAALTPDMPLSEYITEMECLAQHAVSPALRAAALRSAHRFDGPFKVTLKAVAR